MKKKCTRPAIAPSVDAVFKVRLAFESSSPESLDDSVSEFSDVSLGDEVVLGLESSVVVAADDLDPSVEEFSDAAVKSASM